MLEHTMQMKSDLQYILIYFNNEMPWTKDLVAGWTVCVLWCLVQFCQSSEFVYIFKKIEC